MKIEVRGLTKKFGSGTAVGNVSFVVNEGELLGLVGPSGSGKTTVLRLIAGLDSRDLDSPIQHLWMKPIRKDFADKPKFVQNVKDVFKSYYPSLYTNERSSGRVLFNKLYCDSNI